MRAPPHPIATVVAATVALVFVTIPVACSGGDLGVSTCDEQITTYNNTVSSNSIIGCKTNDDCILEGLTCMDLGSRGKGCTKACTGDASCTGNGYVGECWASYERCAPPAVTDCVCSGITCRSASQTH